MPVSNNWTPPTDNKHLNDQSQEPVSTADMHGSWIDSPYSTQGRDMNHMLSQEWTSPDTSFGHPYATTAHPNPALLTPISLSDSAVLDPRHSPVHITHSQGPQYNGMMNHAAQGLGISMSPLSYGLPVTLAHDMSHGSISVLESPFVPTSHVEPQLETATVSPPPQTIQRTGHVPIAPHPAGLQRQEEERQRRGGDSSRSQGRPRQQRRPRRQDPRDEAVTDYTMILKDGERLGWRDITRLVNERFDVNLTTPCLQMRVHRRGLRLTRWNEDDAQRLRTAYSLWEENKFGIIADKMLEMERNEPTDSNANEELKAWNARECKQKWDELFGPQLLPQPQMRDLDEATRPDGLYSNANDTRERTQRPPSPPPSHPRKRQRRH